MKKAARQRPASRMLKRPSSSRRGDTWSALVGQLRHWLRDHGGTYPSRKGSTKKERRLARWINNQRVLHHTGKMLSNRVESLERLRNWSWSACDGSWGLMFKRLRKWLEDNDEDYSINSTPKHKCST